MRSKCKRIAVAISRSQRRSDFAPRATYPGWVVVRAGLAARAGPTSGHVSRRGRHNSRGGRVVGASAPFRSAPGSADGAGTRWSSCCHEGTPLPCDALVRRHVAVRLPCIRRPMLKWSGLRPVINIAAVAVVLVAIALAWRAGDGVQPVRLRTRACWQLLVSVLGWAIASYPCPCAPPSSSAGRYSGRVGVRLPPAIAIQHPDTAGIIPIRRALERRLVPRSRTPPVGGRTARVSASVVDCNLALDEPSLAGRGHRRLSARQLCASHGVARGAIRLHRVAPSTRRRAHTSGRGWGRQCAVGGHPRS